MNIYLIILLIIAIVVFSNLAMLGMVRGSRSMKFNWFNSAKSDIIDPFQEETGQLNELRKQVEELSSKSAPDEQANE